MKGMCLVVATAVLISASPSANTAESATKDFAARVGHKFASDYEPRLNLDVYHSLLDLVSETEQELADLQPRDRIDVQSFIWVIGDYKEDAELPKP